jgi:hypothetical protein
MEARRERTWRTLGTCRMVAKRVLARDPAQVGWRKETKPKLETKIQTKI